VLGLSDPQSGPFIESYRLFCDNSRSSYLM
jgi:hypothetical protein